MLKGLYSVYSRHGLHMLKGLYSVYSRHGLHMLKGLYSGCTVDTTYTC